MTGRKRKNDSHFTECLCDSSVRVVAPTSAAEFNAGGSIMHKEFMFGLKHGKEILKNIRAVTYFLVEGE
jgi:hypothetical protein